MSNTRADQESFAHHSAGHLRINLIWLCKLRSVAVVGQLIAVAVVRFLLGIDLPVASLLGIIGATAASNLLLQLWVRRALTIDALESWQRRGERLLGCVMIADTLLLTALLYVTGGPENPFSIFYLVHVVLAAVLLRWEWSRALTGLAVVCFLFIFFEYRPLPILAAGRALQGLMVALVAAAVIIVYFVARVRSELERRELELQRSRMRKASIERVEALATLAAGAAHELSTPLSTIAVVARELERDLENASASAETVEDARLIRDEVRRCRRILDQMSDHAGEHVGESLVRISASDLLERAVAPLRADHRLTLSWGEGVRDEMVLAPKDALRRALRGLVKNALDAADPDGGVEIDVAFRDETLEIAIVDHGTGMTPEVLARAGDPFYTTKEPGLGMGLGLYLARSVIERLGGSLAIDSAPRRGTRVDVRVPVEPGLVEEAL